MLGDDLRAALPELRAHAESRMGAANGGSDVIVRRKSTLTAQDEATGLETPVWDAVYAGPIRLAGTHGGAASTRTVNIGGAEVQVALREAHFPAAVTDLAESDLIEVTAGENVGLVLQIAEVVWQDSATARRVPVAEAIRPEEW